MPSEDPPPTEALACRWHPVSQVKCIPLLKGGLASKSGLTSQLEQVVLGLFSRRVVNIFRDGESTALASAPNHSLCEGLLCSTGILLSMQTALTEKQLMF